MDKSRLAELREIPLDAVLERFGAQRDPQDPTRNWKTPAGRMTVTGSQFYNHDATQGGGGAIDLVMHLGGFRFKEAIAWLGGNIGREAAVRQYQVESQKHAERILDHTPAPKLGIPEPDAAKLPRVRRYLIEQRALPEAVVDNAIQKGRLWADRHGNAVFGLRDLGGKPIGAELRGTTDKSFHGVRGEKGLFLTGNSRHQTAVFVESAIDALSYQALNPQALVISTTGSGITLMGDMARQLRDRGFRLLAAFDKDTAGDHLAAALGQALGAPVERQYPRVGKDWNEQIQQERITNSKKIDDKER